MSELVKPFNEQVRFLVAMLEDEAFDWEANGYPEFDEEFRLLIETDLKSVDNKDYYECGSYKPTSTPDGMYRLLWLVQPKTVDFSDMYKHSLMWFMSSDRKCIVNVYLFKYELALYYYAPKALIDATEASPVWGGWAGADNGVKIVDPDVKAFTELLQKAVEHTHMVYGGNDFEV